MAKKCRFLKCSDNGTIKGDCAAGVSYDAVFDQKNRTIPCFDPETPCTKRDWFPEIK